jgi:hypothetical protein
VISSSPDWVEKRIALYGQYFCHSSPSFSASGLRIEDPDQFVDHRQLDSLPPIETLLEQITPVTTAAAGQVRALLKQFGVTTHR